MIQVVILQAPIFQFSKNIPIVVNQSLHISLGVVNGKEATVIDDASEVHSLPDNLLAELTVDRLPQCLLIKLLGQKHSLLPGLGNGILPLYPQSFNIEVKIPSKEVASTMLHSICNYMFNLHIGNHRSNYSTDTLLQMADKSHETPLLEKPLALR